MPADSGGGAPRVALERNARDAHAPHDDLVQAGLFGLTKALERYDPSQGPALSSYAVPTMLGEMRRHMRDHTWSVRVPRGLQEDVLRVKSPSASGFPRCR